MNGRTLNNPITNKASSPLRHSYGTQKKLQIIDAYYNKNATETARQFNLAQSMISRWVANEKVIRAHAVTNKKKLINSANAIILNSQIVYTHGF